MRADPFTTGQDYTELLTHIDTLRGNGSPAHRWKGWAVDLGSALGRREESNGGLWTRRFSGGVVYTVEPGGTTHTIKLGKKMYSAEWGWVESITLEPEHGAVLVG